MLVHVVLCVVFCLKVTKVNSAENDILNSVDTIGAVANTVDQIVTQITSPNLRPKDYLCTTRLIKFTDTEVIVSGQPRGTCSYCCPIINPKAHVKLYLTNKSLKGDLVKLKLNNNETLQSAGFKTNIPTVIFFHGFTEHGLGPLPIIIRDAYLRRPDEYNIILVDWGNLASGPWYPQAAKNTKVVANIVSEFIIHYINTGELSLPKLHIVGFSLGAHIAGFIGKNLVTKNKLPRITALDPALPLFSLTDTTQRVSKDDAFYVDVIHTDGGKFGLPISIGHADFYPNRGTYFQPGCTPSSLAENRTIEHFGSCSHQRALHLYAESVWNPKAFPVFKCSATKCKRQQGSYMGFGATKETALGDYYLVTKSQSPFGRTPKN